MKSAGVPASKRVLLPVCFLTQSKSMNNLWLVTLLLALTGCAQTYKVTLNNNNTFTTRGKPKYNPQTQNYEYKESSGKRASVPAIKVKEMEAQ
jgi:hypothetical protein